jgi:DNA repair exonuclease SbcCD nuclease subunit
MTFSIAHLSDLHIGYKSTRVTTNQGINLREADGYVALAGVVSQMLDDDLDAALITGDVFHTPTPDMRSIVFVQNQLRRLAEANIPVYILAGNHDTNDIRADIASSRILHDPDRKIYSHVEPYVKYEVAPSIFMHLVSHHNYMDQAQTMAGVKPEKGAINIFATHGSVIDPILKMKLHTEQSPREIVIPDFMLEDFNWDYVLLGHIHTRGWVGSTDGLTDNNNTKIYYNGSLIRRGFSDHVSPLGRGYTKWVVDSSGEFTAHHRKIAQRPQYDLPIIDGEGKSTKEISEAIVDNLVSTQLHGTAFDTKTAPIIRQRIKAIDSGKYSALDQNAIAANSNHALQWSIKILTPGEANSTGSDIVPDSFESTDVTKIYDKWVKSSSKLSRADEIIRESVETQARAFVEQGQEEILND